jgi:uncharacterized membrane protein YdbT with pleckstrin-like domain
MIDLFKDEQIHAIVRKHWFILLKNTIGTFIFFLIPFIIYMVFPKEGITLSPEMIIPAPSLSVNLIIFLSTAWTIFWWLRLSALWTDYYLDTWIITNERVIDIEQKGFFSRQISSFRIDRIQDVTIDVHGLLATLLHFGNIHVQTAGTKQEFVIQGIPHPDKLKDQIATLAMHR